SGSSRRLGARLAGRKITPVLRRRRTFARRDRPALVRPAPIRPTLVRPLLVRSASVRPGFVKLTLARPAPLASSTVLAVAGATVLPVASAAILTIAGVACAAVVTIAVALRSAGRAVAEPAAFVRLQ